VLARRLKSAAPRLEPHPGLASSAFQCAVKGQQIVWLIAEKPL